MYTFCFRAQKEPTGTISVSLNTGSKRSGSCAIFAVGLYLQLARYLPLLKTAVYVEQTQRNGAPENVNNNAYT